MELTRLNKTWLSPESVREELVASARKSQIGIIERSTAILVLYLASTAYVPLLSSPIAGPDAALVLARYIGYFAAGVLVVGFFRSVIRGARHATPIILLVGLAILSSAWSYAPGIALEQSLVLAGMTAFGLYLGARYTLEELLTVIATMSAIMAILSLGTAVIPKLGGVTEQGNWQGVLADKNVFGIMMAFGAVVWIVKLFSNAKNTVVAPGFVLLTTTMVLLSGSATSLVVLLAVIGCFFVVQTSRSITGMGSLILALGGILGPVLIIWSLQNFGVILEILGRNATLTGRTDVWRFSWELVKERFWWGHGYASIWGAKGTLSYDMLMHQVGWIPQHAHNGFLDLWLRVGIVGVGLFLFSYLTIAPKAIACVAPRNSLSTFPLLFLVFFVSYNLVESALMVHLQFFWIIYTSLACNLTRMGKRRIALLGCTAADVSASQSAIHMSFKKGMT